MTEAKYDAIQPQIQDMSTQTNAASYRSAFAVVTSLFFMWGFVTVLNDVLVPHLKAIFDLNYARVMLIQFAFFSAYFLFSIPSAKVIDWLGYKKTMVIGVLTMGLGALLFLPAANLASYALFLGALMILAAGITALQVAANPYIAVLGDPETASSRLNLSQAFNSLGTTIAPYLGGLLILGTAARSVEAPKHLAPAAMRALRIQEAASVKIPYLTIGLALILLAGVIALFKLPPIPQVERHETTSMWEVWQHRHLVLGAIAIFLYVGAEVAIGSFLINYFAQPNIGNIPEVVGARYVSYYWFGAMVGRAIGAAILQRVRTGTVLGIAALMACLLVCLSIFTMGHLAMGSIILVGLFNSVMFPSIFTLGIARLGPLTGDGSGLLIMAIVGGAIVPVLQGAVADRIGIHYGFVIPAVCYVYIVYYAFRGSKPFSRE